MPKNTFYKFGFTIVELLIVIVIIAVLATLSIGVYSGIQQRARDSQRKNDVAQIVKALHLYNIDKGNYVIAGCGSANTGDPGNGWFNYTYPGFTSINDCLKNAGYIQKDIKDPLDKNSQDAENCVGTNCTYYMKYTCPAGTYVYANLESFPHTASDTDQTCNANLDTVHGMNYFVKVN